MQTATTSTSGKTKSAIMLAAEIWKTDVKCSAKPRKCLAGDLERWETK